MADFLVDAELAKKDGSKAKGGDVLKGKTVALYFSAHWCPPCRTFTPILKDFYEHVVDEHNLPFELVFVSFDRSEDDLKKYLEEAHGDWYHVPFGDKKIQELAEKYGVSGIPALIIIKANGDVISKNGRAEVGDGSPDKTFQKWHSQA